MKRALLCHKRFSLQLRHTYFLILFTELPQDEASGHRILKGNGGNHRCSGNFPSGSVGFQLETSGKTYENGRSIPAGIFHTYFQIIPTGSVNYLLRDPDGSERGKT